MFKDKYKLLMDSINAPEQLVHSIESTECEKYKFSLSKKPVMIFAAMCFCVFIALPVAAANNADIYHLMYMVSPAVAQYFSPVQMSCEDNGIKMEVVSASVIDNEIQVYITMQDIETDRISGPIDLNDSYTINSPFDTVGHCSFVGYDEKTEKATFLVSVEIWDDMKIENSKITFSVRNFLNNKHHYTDVEIPVQLDKLSPDVGTQKVQITGAGGTGWNRGENFDGTVLMPGAPLENFSVDGVAITGAGYINGKLHIQTAVTDRNRNDNHGLMYLINENGNREEYIYSVTFKESKGNTTISYDEYVFDVTQDKISAYNLYGEFWTASGYTEGNWSVTFRI